MAKVNEKAIFKWNLASKLLEMGNPIIRLARNQHSNNPVFYFAGTNKLYRDLKIIEENYY